MHEAHLPQQEWQDLTDKASGFCRMTIRHETRRSDDDRLRERMKSLAHERRRFGYRRIHVLLKREGTV